MASSFTDPLIGGNAFQIQSKDTNNPGGFVVVTLQLFSISIPSQVDKCFEKLLLTIHILFWSLNHFVCGEKKKENTQFV